MIVEFYDFLDFPSLHIYFENVKLVHDGYSPNLKLDATAIADESVSPFFSLSEYVLFYFSVLDQSR